MYHLLDMVTQVLLQHFMTIKQCTLARASRHLGNLCTFTEDFLLTAPQLVLIYGLTKLLTGLIIITLLQKILLDGRTLVITGHF
jgi:hypothetical protein